MNVARITKDLLMHLTADLLLTAPYMVAGRLFGMGGALVAWMEPDPHGVALRERGRLFDQQRRLRRGRPNRCHGNAARLWAADPARHTLVTGYALNHCVWRQHSWVVAGKTLLETTSVAELYFGVELAEDEALLFWEA